LNRKSEKFKHKIEGGILMKNLFKIFLLSLYIFIISTSLLYAANYTDPLKVDEPYQIQPTASVEA